MDNWVDYYDNRAIESQDFLYVSEVQMKDESSTLKFLEEEKLRILHLLNPDSDFTLLDLGCCVGVCMGLIKDSYKSVVGVDLSNRVLDIAKKRLPDCQFILGDITSNKLLVNETFDHITTYGVLHYLPKNILELYFDNVYRLLKPGGKAVVTRTPNASNFDQYQTYRKSKNKNNTTENKLSWNWISPKQIIDICSDRFEVIIILPTAGADYPFKAFFDFVLIKK